MAFVWRVLGLFGGPLGSLLAPSCDHFGTVLGRLEELLEDVVLELLDLDELLVRLVDDRRLAAREVGQRYER